jgi:predicted nucleic acid-binding protein
MDSSVYIESTIPSFLVGEISPVLTTAAHQLATRHWWRECRGQYELCVSPIVVDEVSRGESALAEERLQLVAELPQLDVTPDVVDLARQLEAALALPEKAATDALHIALACHYEIDYLLTWNLKHIASGQVRHALARRYASLGLVPPTICTPEELLEWSTEP